MNLGNYNFHQDSKKYLTEFLKEVKESQIKNIAPTNNTNWKLIFKHGPEIQIEDETEVSQNQVIDLTIDKDANETVEGIDVPQIQLKQIPSTQLNQLQETVDIIICERGNVQEDFLVSLENNCIINIQELCEHLVNINDKSVLSKFGYSILVHNCSDKIFISYLKYILIPSAISQLTDDIKDMFQKFIQKISGVVSILLQFMDANSNIIIELTSSLKCSSKLKLFEDCVSTTTSLEIRHIHLLDNLLVKEASRDNFKKLIDLLTAVGDKYATDKVYGRYILKLIETLGADVKYFQNEISDIIRKHKSIWKNKAEKIFLENIESEPMNVTQSFLV